MNRVDESSTSPKTQRSGDQAASDASDYRPPWLILIVGYLLISGLFGAIEFLLDLFFLGAEQFVDITLAEAWAWADQFKFYRRGVLLSVFLAAAWILWFRPTWVTRIVLVVAIAQIIGASFNNFGYVWRIREFVGFALSAAFVVSSMAELAIPIFGLWFVHRVGILRRPEIVLIAGFLLIDGGFGVIGLAMLFPFAQGSGLLSELYFTMTVIGEIAAKTLFFICGLLLVKRSPRLLAISWGVLAVTFLSLLPEVLPIISDDSRFGYMGWGKYVYLFSQHGQVATAVFLIVFAYRFKGRLGGDAPACRKCDYNLTGNVSGTCPECGTGFES